MITTFIPIGNSQGIRIPKTLIAESGLGNDIELQIKKGEIRIIPAPPKATTASQTALLSQSALSDWSRPEEDEAWASLQ